MFRCDLCWSNVSGRMYKKVTEKRDKEYRNSITKYRDGQKTEETKITKGWEIVEELSLCEKCYDKK